jgi:dihydroxyacid dehydratase/phosphogluconate dehydratase
MVVIAFLQVMTMVLGGSTNAVLHLIAMAHSVGIKLDIDDFQSVSDRTPFLADIKPSGKYVMEDVYKIGGIPSEFGPRKHLVFLNRYHFHARGPRIPPKE